MKVNLLLYKSSKVCARHIKSVAPLICLSIVFLFLPAFDLLVTSGFPYWILFIFKTSIGFSIAFILIFKYFDELYDLIDNFEVEQNNIKTGFWIFKKRNIVSMIKLLIYLIPFAALSTYYLIKISTYIEEAPPNFSDLLAPINPEATSGLVEMIQSYLPDFIFRFSFVYSNEVYLMLSSFGLLVFLLTTGLTFGYIILKISMINMENKFYKTIRENVKGQINNNYQNQEIDIFDNLKIEIEQEILQTDRDSQQVETNIINTKESDMLTTIKKGTTPPLGVKIW